MRLHCLFVPLFVASCEASTPSAGASSTATASASVSASASAQSATSGSLEETSGTLVGSSPTKGLAAALAAAPTLAHPTSSTAIDGVLLVTIDTLRADVLGAYGGPLSTPTLDALAHDGWLFENCLTASMLTNPSHASIMTSLYPRDHGVYDNESGIHADARTLAGALKRNGVRTAAVIGFPHLNPEVSNLGLGFDKVVKAERRERRADETSAVALQALDEIAPSGPFFLWVHYTDPHAPYDPPPDVPLHPLVGKTPMRVAVRAAPGFQRKNPWFRKAFSEHRFTEELVQRYWAEVEATDRGLGLLFDGLAKRGRLEHTAVIVTSDHGENLGEHGLYFHHGGLYRETVHVPLIVKLPGQSPARISGLVETVDIAPTALEAAGAPLWEPMRGHSLIAAAQGSRPGRSISFTEHQLAQAAAVYTSSSALIVQRKASAQFPSYPFIEGRLEAFDLARDPTQTQPLGPASHVHEQLAPELFRYLGAGPEIVGRKAAQQDRDSLRTLGYIE